ncbi:MAG TPA: 3-keto-5-aminohexanoate cleavage protein, partial [Rhizobiales bacterium]|nr:3-keto-5-aminohexanoate cleavage protein [Hyphomicrobiales bacterium]
MSPITTAAPSAPNRRAMPSPNPDAPPVMTATFPCNRMIFSPALSGNCFQVMGFSDIHVENAMANRAMVMVAPNGARRGKADHPRLPVTASELAREAALCADAGAVAIHTHVRDEAGVHCLDVDRYREAIAAIRAECGGRLKIQITTEAVGIYSPQEQIACVKALRPDAASVALKEIVPDEAHEDRAREFFQWMRGEGVSAQIILYSAAEVERFWRLQEKGVTGFAEPFLLFVLGRYASDGQSEPREVDPFVAALGSHRANWAVCAFGRREAA